MSILIKKMEMPKNCGQCFLRGSGCKNRLYDEMRPTACPLVEVPTPHGRLIEAIEYEKRIKPYDTEDVMDKALYNFAHDKLVSTSTIIEAEEE